MRRAVRGALQARPTHTFLHSMKIDPSTEILNASPVDIAADMSHHRQTYLRFLNLMKWVSVGSAAILMLVFFLLY